MILRLYSGQYADIPLRGSIIGVGRLDEESGWHVTIDCRGRPDTYVLGGGWARHDAMRFARMLAIRAAEEQ